ncbi:aspartate carbamoyltransferase catalytic subunit [Thermodesulfovibrionales bacterium]|nr:aspartate carbamoyltransferase catalytic subunit [Thermodesulfovibrionales bacterium]MCL0035678.1 aspartate carbamoyltransferase catalytic subunit [Thermodesulfovibrionales bacterium]MCL0042712.1 aspartate carbamoyltransferase catalytic subunit [Thermodesulfovibrionales bacterium]MCL0051731.1 aspartate carbamoyltransferase catalytic subunit [Thermodesulfovibrionales bacterium]MCL0062165.1 aspartate carbamoyltransferase catalytic subunit [Thermodesulfovibrionales bacterium]
MRKDLVGIKDLSRKEIELILGTSSSFKDVLKRDIKKVPALRGKTAVNLFFEPSTRTRASFELAEKRLSTDVLNLSMPTSSVVKGEVLLDTAKTIDSYGIDFVVIRHSSSGAPHFIARNVSASVINAGDGINEHPTQALLDAFSIVERKGRLDGLKIAIVGDILHSRVAKSNIYLLSKFDVAIRLIGPPTMIADMADYNVDLFYDMDRGLEDVDIVMMLRIQIERQGKGIFPSIQEYAKKWGLNMQRLGLAKRDAIVMHPGPMNRGVEISSDVVDSGQSIIFDQVTNGLAVRMTVMYLLGGSQK